VPAGIDLAAFRIVQDALTNVRKHASAAPTEVLVHYARDAILVEVSNAVDGEARPASDGPSYGIAGMRERARMYGGTLDAGPRDGRYVMRAHLPLAGGAG
jgi:signal transduction histidine kinase